MNHYLVVFDRARGQVVRCERFDERSDALRARFDAERAAGHSSDIEVVVLGANSLDALRRTHGRYFNGLSELARAASAAR